MDDKEVDEADAIGESSGVLASELAAVEGTESTGSDRRIAPFWARAVVAMLDLGLS